MSCTIRPVNISGGEQFKPDLLRIVPNNRISTITDTSPADGGEPISMSNSDAILRYRATAGASCRQRSAAATTPCNGCSGRWALGPVAGRHHHFVHYAPEPIAYAIERQVKETSRPCAGKDDQPGADHR